MKFAFFAALLFLAGCVPQRQWRTQPYSASRPTTTPQTSVEDRFVIPADPEMNRFYSMAFVEFKNDGQVWNPGQLQEALHAIDDADARSNHHALVVTFVHGWKNNARQVNNNVHDFRVQLNNMAAKYCVGDKRSCGVVGIYLAWSGDLIARDWNTLRQMTYANRRDTASNVALNKQEAKKASSSPFGQTLRDIMKQVKTGPGRETNQSIIVGHSFGGLILEYAIQDQMEEIGKELHEELKQNPNASTFKLAALADFADLVVLINQAAPADHAIELLSQYRTDLQQVELRWPPKKTGCPSTDNSVDCRGATHPLLLSVSSEADLATRTILPIAETILPPKDRPKVLPPDTQLPKGLDTKKVFTTAAAHTPQLYSHALRKCGAEDCSPCMSGNDGDNLPASIILPAYAPGNPGHTDLKLNYCLVPDSTAWNRTPYWIFHIPAEIVPDHGTIFTDRFRDFLTSFLPSAEAFAQPGVSFSPRMYRSIGK